MLTVPELETTLRRRI